MPFKTCPGCAAKHGPRAKLCECGHSFSEKRVVKRQKELFAEQPKVIYHELLKVIGPAGKCPATLTGFSEDEVFDWAEKVWEAGQRIGLDYQFEALAYFLLSFCEYGTPDFRGAKEFVKNWFKLRGGQSLESIDSAAERQVLRYNC